MKKLAVSGIALALTFLCSGNAFAMEVPTDTTVQNLNNVQQCIKTYTVAPETDPQSLIEEPFEYEGYVYTFSTITKKEISYEDSQPHVETVTVKTQKDDLATVLETLPPTMAFDDGRYSGTLNLDHTTLKTEAAGYTTKSYTVSETKEIGNLDSNDMSYVPATTVKDGKTIRLQSVSWQVQGTALVDDVLVPSQYTAVATYSGKAYYSAATGYITTAEYVGDISCNEVESIAYTVTYTGEEAANDSIFACFLRATPYLLGGFGGMAIIALLIVLSRSRRRVRPLQDEDIEMAEYEEVSEDET